MNNIKPLANYTASIMIEVYRVISGSAPIAFRVSSHISEKEDLFTHLRHSNAVVSHLNYTRMGKCRGIGHSKKEAANNAARNLMDAGYCVSSWISTLVIFVTHVRVQMIYDQFRSPRRPVY